MATARGEVYMTDRIELEVVANDYDEDVDHPDTAWRGIIYATDGRQLWRGRAYWTRSEAWEAMFIANEENGWEATIKAPLPDGAPI